MNPIFYWITFLLLAAVCASSIYSQPSKITTTETDIAIVKEKVVNLRAGQSDKFSVLKKVKLNDTLKVKKEFSDWVEVDLGSRKAFVYKPLVNLTRVTEEVKSEQKRMYAFIGFAGFVLVGFLFKKKNKEVYQNKFNKKRRSAFQNTEVAIQFYKRGKYEDALNYLEKPENRIVSSEQTLMIKGYCLIQTGNLFEAVDTFLKLIKLYPDKSKYYYELARLKSFLYLRDSKLADKKQALKFIQKAIEISPSNEVYHAALEAIQNDKPVPEKEELPSQDQEPIEDFRENELFNKPPKIIRFHKDFSQKDDDLQSIPSFVELSKMIGLDGVKEEIQEFAAIIQWEMRKKGLKKNEKPPAHMLFVGPPGTGKTTVARLLGDILRDVGYLDSGHVVEVNRDNLVGQHIGETAPKTKAKIEEAMGGILFLDEAYSLTSGGDQDFGAEAITAILTEMENKRSQFIFIAAGYPDPMKNFLDSNEGLRSRFTGTIHFSDYSPSELFEIFELLMSDESYMITSDAGNIVKLYLEEIYLNKDKNFGNGREVRKLFESIKKKLALRKVYEKDSEALIIEEDVTKAIQKLEASQL